jgi:hypothetical protein
MLGTIAATFGRILQFSSVEKSSKVWFHFITLKLEAVEGRPRQWWLWTQGRSGEGMGAAGLC